MSIISTKIIRSRRRSLSLQILPDKTIIVKSPMFLPQREIDKFLDKYNGWIEKRLATIKDRKPARQYIEGEEFLYLGETIRLKIGDYESITVSSGFLYLPLHMTFRAKKEIESWYIKQAQKIIIQMLDRYSKEFNTSFKALTFSDTRSKWGSCTHDNRLQFSWRLIMAPELVIRYVVIHELAHTKEKNHSRSFWIKVASINPSYKQQIKWLKQNGPNLHF